MNAAQIRLHLPTIDLAPVRLRPWRPDDAPALVMAWADPSIGGLGIVGPPGTDPVPRDRTLEGAISWISGTDERCRRGLAVDLVVADIDDDRVLGEVGLSAIDPRRGAALIGWWIGAAERGRGVATVAVDGFAAWAIERAGLRALVAEIGHDNPVSWRIALRCGFDVLREPTDDQMGAVVRRVSAPT